VPRKYVSEHTGQISKVIGLQQRRNRARFGQALIEGPQAIRELMAFAPELIRDVYVTDEALIQYPDLDALLQRIDPYTHVVDPRLHSTMSADAQGWLAVVNTPSEPSLKEFFAAERKLVACLVESADPGNLGTIIRTADAAGADGILLGKGSVELFNPKVVRASVGSVFHLPILTGVDIDEAATRARSNGLRILLADGTGTADLFDLSNLPVSSQAGSKAPDLASPTMWLIGNEAHGFTAAHLALADHVIRIPMWGHAESLNAAVAASLSIYASASAQRRASTPDGE